MNVLQSPRVNFHGPCQLYNVTISQAPPSCINLRRFLQTSFQHGHEDGSGREPGSQPPLESGPSVDPGSVTHRQVMQHFASVSPSLSPGGWCQRQTKALGKIWDDATLLCHFLNRFQDIHCRGLIQSALPPLILTYMPPRVLCIFTNFWRPLLFPLTLPQKVGRTGWFHKYLSRHNASKCNIFWSFTSECDVRGCKFSEKHWLGDQSTEGSSSWNPGLVGVKQLQQLCTHGNPPLAKYRHA